MGSWESLTFPSLSLHPLLTGGHPLLFFSFRQPDGRECRQADDLRGFREGLAVGTCHSRAGGVDEEFNESSTATSGQDAALCGHQTARQYTILPPFQSFSGPLSY